MRRFFILILATSGEKCGKYNYTGNKSTTASGKTCQRWDVQKPHRLSESIEQKVRNLARRDHNYCRNPDEDPKGNWCYTIDPKTRYDYCQVPECEIPSKVSHCWKSGRNGYLGTKSTTKKGFTCQPWNNNYPHKPKYWPTPRNHNFCRNPVNDSKGPWCYTTDPRTRWDYCDIAPCDDQTVTTVPCDDADCVASGYNEFDFNDEDIYDYVIGTTTTTTRKTTTTKTIATTTTTTTTEIINVSAATDPGQIQVAVISGIIGIVMLSVTIGLLIRRKFCATPSDSSSSSRERARALSLQDDHASTAFIEGPERHRFFSSKIFFVENPMSKIFFVKNFFRRKNNFG